MSSIVQPSDFGDNSLYKLPQNTQTVDLLESVINEWEERYLNYLLGVELNALFIADLVNGVPQTQRFIDIYNKFFDKQSCYVIESLGMNETLQALIWGRYNDLLDVQSTTVGTKTNNSSNSDNAQLQNSRSYDIYNKGVQSYRAIQWFICENTDDYPEYDGSFIELKTWL